MPGLFIIDGRLLQVQFKSCLHIMPRRLLIERRHSKMLTHKRPYIFDHYWCHCRGIAGDWGSSFLIKEIFAEEAEQKDANFAIELRDCLHSSDIKISRRAVSIMIIPLIILPNSIAYHIVYHDTYHTLFIHTFC